MDFNDFDTALKSGISWMPTPGEKKKEAKPAVPYPSAKKASPSAKGKPKHIAAIQEEEEEEEEEVQAGTASLNPASGAGEDEQAQINALRDLIREVSRACSSAEPSD